MNEEIKAKFSTYPPSVYEMLLDIRSLILATAKNFGASNVEESLKWGEPSYLVKGGSPVRYDWKTKSPDYVAVYFNCNTTLVSTFREIYGDVFTFEGNRSIRFLVGEPYNQKALQHCIEVALTYHKVKKLPLLGMTARP